jgi:hypothetical protein
MEIMLGIAAFSAALTAAIKMWMWYLNEQSVFRNIDKPESRDGNSE